MENRYKVCSNEMIKFWGNAFEMITYQITGGLMAENPFYFRDAASWFRETPDIF